MKEAYINNLKDKLWLESTTSAEPSNVYHDLVCLLCGVTFNAVPKDKVHKFKKHNKPGCPDCVSKEQYTGKKEKYLSKLQELGFELLEEYQTADTHTLLRKVDCCGRGWKARPHSIVQKNPTCKPCRDDVKKTRDTTKELKDSAPKGMKPEYLAHLENDIKLKVLSPILGSHVHHNIQCVICNHVFKATPKSKVKMFKDTGRVGCPNCYTKNRYSPIQENIVYKLTTMGFELLEPYTNTHTKVLVINTNCCGRSFSATPNNMLNGNTICPPCNKERKGEAFRGFNQERHDDTLSYMKGFAKYSHRVRVLTEGAYRKHKDVINPQNLPRRRAGTKGYHLDHIYSVSSCFHAGIPEELCAHRENLQMLTGKDNVVKHNKPPATIPTILESFLH